MGAASFCEEIVLHKQLIVYCRCDSTKVFHLKLLSPSANGFLILLSPIILITSECQVCVDVYGHMLDLFLGGVV